MRNAGDVSTPAASGEGTHPVVLFFGLIGALFGGVFGLIVAGVGAGILKKTGFGRVVLRIVGLGFAALIALEIWKA